MPAPDPYHERMDALTEAIVRLLRRQSDLESRVASLESDLRAARGEPAPAAAVPPPVPEFPSSPPSAPPPPPAPEPEPPVPEFPSPAAPLPAAASAPSPVLETRLGLTWINRIGAFTFLLSVAFFFKLAVDNDWIGENGRVILGVFGGFAAVAAGDWFWRKGHLVYAQGVSALGLGILYLSFYAAYGFYRLVPGGFAFVLLPAACAMGGALALRYNAQAILILGLLGAYATPILLSTGEDRPWALFGYVAIVNLAALAAARYRRWRAAEWFALAGTAFLYGAWFEDRFRGNPEQMWPAAVFAAIFAGQFLTSRLRPVAAFAQAGALLAMGEIWDPGLGPYIPFAIALAIAGLAAAALRDWPWHALLTTALAYVSYSIWNPRYAAEPLLLRDVCVLTALFALFFAWLPGRVLLRRGPVSAYDLLVTAANAVLFYGLLYEALDPAYPGYLALAAVALGAAHLAAGYSLRPQLDLGPADSRPALLSGGLAACFVTLAVPIYFTGFSITLAWAVELAAVAWIAHRLAAPRLLFGVAALAVLVLARVFLFEIDIYNEALRTLPFANARFLAIFAAALAFFFATWWTSLKPARLALYLAGHACLFLGLAMEVDDLAAQRIAAQSISSLRGAFLSMLLAAYAVALTASGVLYRLAVNRILGLVVFGLVILKLYLLDIWNLQLAYRVMAFAALGALLLITSFLYSRFRPSIEAWWKQEDSRD